MNPTNGLSLRALDLLTLAFIAVLSVLQGVNAILDGAVPASVFTLAIILGCVLAAYFIGRRRGASRTSPGDHQRLLFQQKMIDGLMTVIIENGLKATAEDVLTRTFEDEEGVEEASFEISAQVSGTVEPGTDPLEPDPRWEDR